MLEVLKDGRIEDFTIYYTQNGQPKLVYIARKHGSFPHRMGISLLSPLNPTHYMEVSENSLLIKTIHPYADMEGSKIHLAEYDSGSYAWSILGIFETSPRDRFNYLINKCQFKEATEFGKRYNLHDEVRISGLHVKYNI